jgi:hypothetical protein
MQEKRQLEPVSQDFKILFDSLEELKSLNSELFEFKSQLENSFPSDVEEIKKIVEACSSPESFTTFTRAGNSGISY